MHLCFLYIDKLENDWMAHTVPTTAQRERQSTFEYWSLGAFYYWSSSTTPRHKDCNVPEDLLSRRAPYWHGGESQRDTERLAESENKQCLTFPPKNNCDTLWAMCLLWFCGIKIRKAFIHPWLLWFHLCTIARSTSLIRKPCDHHAQTTSLCSSLCKLEGKVLTDHAVRFVSGDYD